MDLLVATAIIGPVVAGIIVYVFRDFRVRVLVVLATALLLGTNSTLVYQSLPFSYSPAPNFLFGFSLVEIVTLADFGLLAFFLYAGLSLKSRVATLSALVQVFTLAYLEFALLPHEEITPVFFVDHMAFIFNAFITFVGSAVAIYSLHYMERYRKIHGPRKARPHLLFFYLLSFLGIMNGLVFANDLLLFFFFWEATTLISFLLILLTGTPEATRNATRALWMNLLGGAALVISLAVLAARGNPLTLGHLVAQGLAGRPDLLAAALLTLATFTKAALLPFHTWLVGAMVAPTPVSALLHSSTMVKAAVYLLIRLAPVFQGTTIGQLVALAGGFSFAVTAAMAISQTNGKKVLAYSTIGNLGLITAAAAIGTPLAVAAALVLSLFHALSKGLLFLVVGNIELGVGTKDIEEMEGLLRKMPITTLISIAGMISIVFPPFGVLVGKWLTIEAVVRSPLVLLLVILGSALTIVFWSKWIGRVASVTYQAETRKEKIAAAVLIPLLALLSSAILASFSLAPIYRTLVAPYITALYGSPGLIAPDGQVLSRIGRFAPWEVFLILLLILLATRAAFLTMRPVKVIPPFLCGENAQEEPQLQFRSAQDVPTEVSVGNYYLEKVFGEDFLSRRATPVAIGLLMLIIGVSTR